ncbi:MAG: hypothetical protein P8L85_06455 [Rubripirellula sp.]|nr:hypothetical protein [Rubripirellula sp.]
MLDDPFVTIRDAILCSGNRRLHRDERWTQLDYGKTGELFDMQHVPQQYTDLFNDTRHAEIIHTLQQKLKDKLSDITLNAIAASELEREFR